MRLSLVILPLLLACLTACTRPAGVLFEPASSVHAWPTPPDEARIRYVGEIRSESDLKPARGVGESIGRFLFGKETPKGMVGPLGVCTDGGDLVFIADPNAQTLHVFDLASRRYRQWTPPPKSPRFVQPIAVAFDAGRVLVSDSAAGVIFEFDTKGVFRGLLGEGVLQRPCGLAVEPGSGNIFVADAAAHQIVVLSPDGTESARIGSRGQDAGRFNFPTYVAFDSRARLYVSDSLNFRVQVFGPHVEFIREIGRKGDMPGYFAQPKGIALDPEDHLYVVDANFEAVQVFDPDGNLLMTFGHEGRGPGEFWLPVGISADPKGRLWIADSYNRRVQVFQYLPAGGNP
ncbi:hypothetical protein PHYC_00722 [Phycisphaerales bacterium]|nr:hypothetical protein PHYC_00722 [Phycisphaerales bacterium]